MTGKYRIRIRDRHNDYEFELKRNITVLCGDSGRGKTTLYEMIRDYNQNGRSSGVSISCDKQIIALDGYGWDTRIESLSDCIIVVDEDSHFIKSNDFARAVKGSDNYYLLITRNYLPNLPYSVDEIYKIAGRKNKRLINVYESTLNMYDKPAKNTLPFVPDVMITEDSRAGYQFYKHIADQSGIDCVSANGKSNVFELLKKYRDKKAVVIADGAAFGSDMHNVAEQQKLLPDRLAIFLPESFEWLILKAEVTGSSHTDRMASPEMYADSRKYMSWEQYFTELLIETTKASTYMKYDKERLAEYYTHEGTVSKICEEIKGIKFSKEEKER